MLKKVNSILDILFGAIVVVYVGYGIYLYRDYQTHPDLYAMQSAPWYTGIIVYGVFAAVFLLVIAGGKWVVRNRMKK